VAIQRMNITLLETAGVVADKVAAALVRAFASGVGDQGYDQIVE